MFPAEVLCCEKLSCFKQKDLHKCTFNIGKHITVFARDRAVCMCVCVHAQVTKQKLVSLLAFQGGKTDVY